MAEHRTWKRANRVPPVSTDLSSQDSCLQPCTMYMVFSDPHNLQEHSIKTPSYIQNIFNIHCHQPMYIYQEGELHFSARFNSLTFHIIPTVVGTREGYLGGRKPTQLSLRSSQQSPWPQFLNGISLWSTKGNRQTTTTVGLI